MELSQLTICILHICIEKYVWVCIKYSHPSYTWLYSFVYGCMLGYGLPRAKVAFWLPISDQNHSGQMWQVTDPVLKETNAQTYAQTSPHTQPPVLVHNCTLSASPDHSHSLDPPVFAAGKLWRNCKGSSCTPGTRKCRLPHPTCFYCTRQARKEKGKSGFKNNGSPQSPLLPESAFASWPRFKWPSSCLGYSPACTLSTGLPVEDWEQVTQKHGA